MPTLKKRVWGNRIEAVSLEEYEDVLRDEEVEHLFNYFKRVKKIYLSTIVIIIVLFAVFIFAYGLDLYKQPFILGIFLIIIVVLYLLSMVLLMNFRKKVRRLKGKL